MTYREALDDLKKLYGETAGLSYYTGQTGGKEFVNITAYGDGEVGHGINYETAIVDLSARLNGPSEPPSGEG